MCEILTLKHYQGLGVIQKLWAFRLGKNLSGKKNKKSYNKLCSSASLNQNIWNYTKSQKLLRSSPKLN